MTNATTAPTSHATTNGTGHATPKPPAPDAATALFERKLALADKLQCRDLLIELEVADAEASDALEAVERAELRIRQAKGELEEIATLATLGIEGRNEAERKENRAKTLNADTGYRAALATLTAAENERITLAANAERAKRNARRIQMVIEYRIGVMAFLAG